VAEDEGKRSLFNVRPMVPASVNDDRNVISRAIPPIIERRNMFPGACTRTGIGEFVQTFFLSRRAPTAAGRIGGTAPSSCRRPAATCC
jgi:hypothetical protein